MWSAVRELLGRVWNPSCFADIFRLLHAQRGQSKRVLGMACAALLWTLWNLRNKFSIDGVFPRQPADALYKMSMYLQVWKLVARKKDREAVEWAVTRIRTLHSTIRDRDSA
jgi:hypothetical protein